MDQDDEVHRALRALARSREPDLGAVRARFEEGRGRPEPVGGAARWSTVVAAAAAGLVATLLLWPTPGPSGPNGPARSTVPAGSTGPAGSTAPTAPAGSSAPTAPTGSTGTPRPGPTSEATGSLPTAVSDPVCAFDGRVTVSPFVISNNAWNARADDGRQCVQQLSGPGPGELAWTTWWDWTGRPDQVKSYPSAVLGWHWGRSTERTGLPVRLDGGGSVRTRWSYRLEQQRPGTADVAYDLFLHRRSDPDWGDQPDAEVRLVLTPWDGAGSERLGAVEVDGVRWEVRRRQASWPVYLLVRLGSSTPAVDLDLLPVLRALEPYGLDRRLHLSSVEAGVDVVSGAGRLVTLSYAVTVR